MIDVHAKEVMAWIRRHGFVVSVDLHTPESLVALYDDAYSAGMAQQREADAKEIESLWAHIDEANEAIRYLFPHNQLVTKQGKHANVIAYALTSLPKRFFDSEAGK